MKSDGYINFIFVTFPSWENITSKAAAYDMFSVRPRVIEMRAAFKDVHVFYDHLVDSGLHSVFCKFASLLLFSLCLQAMLSVSPDSLT